MSVHHLKSSVQTCHWGSFDAGLTPAMQVRSGDTVTIDTVTGAPANIPSGSNFVIPEPLAAIHASLRPDPGPHILTGPVFIETAKPGNVLEVRIHEVSLLQNWGFQLIIPLAGTLPREFGEHRQIFIPLDAETMLGTMPWGLQLKLRPFFGVMGVAPPPGWGRATSVMPQPFGGNLDNKELVAGTTLYLPVFTEGALFSCGDGHGVQGDGEVCITAIETALRGTFEFIVRDDITLTTPRAETATHWITMGMDQSLDECARIALRDMITLIGEIAGLGREDAYMLCSLAGDLRITQTVNLNKGVHMMIEKSVLTRA